MTDMFNDTTTEKAAAWAEVILPLALPTVYTYAIPPSLLEKAKAGCRAEVILGPAKKYAGIIRAVHTKEPAFKTRLMLNVLDEDPLVFPWQLQLWKWMSEYYMCSEGEVMAAALPANFKLSSETILIYNETFGEDFSSLTDHEFLVAEALLLKKQLNLTEVQQVLDSAYVYPVIKKLIDKSVCYAWEEMAERYKPRTASFVDLDPAYRNDTALEELLNHWKGAPRQMDLLLALIHLTNTEGEVSQDALLKKSGCTAAQLKGLAEKGIVRIEKRRVDRLPALPRSSNIDFELSDLQATCLHDIKKSFAEKPVCLFHGVTGSGKTMIYINLLQDIIREGKQALYLLPEIALTSQIIRRLQKHFGGNIAIYHSKFNNQERVELWNRIRSGDVSIILGARSALFLPFDNLGLVIIDEEQDASFKQQDPAPRYNARDAAIYLASQFAARVLLGSATPSVESFYNARQGKYGLVTLAERYGNILLPVIEIVNTRLVNAKAKVMISPQLKEGIESALVAGKQVILFQNRRGYNPYLICGTCGYIPQCIHCDVSLTLHKYSNKLHCHYCGSTYPKLVACTACGTQTWMEKNFGTEKIEEQLEEDFKDHRIGRMDIDSVKGKTAHDVLIQSFEQQRLDILVGTQMVVKGLDFDHVSLVGILDADGLLSFADFRVNERAFQLMEQVSGRAGRKHEQGKVVIQAMNVQHPVLQWVQDHDYNAFFDAELEKRREFFYPPFSRMVQLTLKHKDNELLDRAAARLAGALVNDLGNYISGPAIPVIGRMRNLYIREIMIRLPKETGMGPKYKQVIRNQINLLHAEKEYRSIQVIPDVDPM